MINRELHFRIQQEVRNLGAQFNGLAPISILLMNLEDIYEENKILNGIDELIQKNIINKTNDNQYLRSCY